MRNQSNFQVGEKVRGQYYSVPFSGVIVHKQCLNNGIRPKWGYSIKLDHPINTSSFQKQTSIMWIDRDQLSASEHNALILLRDK